MMFFYDMIVWSMDHHDCVVLFLSNGDRFGVVDHHAGSWNYCVVLDDSNGNHIKIAWFLMIQMGTISK